MRICCNHYTPERTKIKSLFFERRHFLRASFVWVRRIRTNRGKVFLYCERLKRYMDFGAISCKKDKKRKRFCEKISKRRVENLILEC